jgi:hypothetical protein
MARHGLGHHRDNTSTFTSTSRTVNFLHESVRRLRADKHFANSRDERVSCWPDKEAQLAQRMLSLGVREADIEETFVRSGGMEVKTSKGCHCVMLLHRPTRMQ